MPDVFNHLFLLAERQSRSPSLHSAGTELCRSSAWEISAPFLESSKAWDTAGCCLLQNSPPREGRLRSLCLALHTARHSTKPENHRIMAWVGKDLGVRLVPPPPWAGGASTKVLRALSNLEHSQGWG